MLIITRNIGESLIIAGDIKVVLLSRKGNQIKVGVEAPKGIDVHREEIFDLIHDETLEDSDLMDKEQKAVTHLAKRYKIDEKLLERARTGDKNAEFEIGKIMFRQERYGLARDFLELAAQKGIDEANKILRKIEKIEKD